MRLALSSLCFLGISLLSTAALAVRSAELYTSAPYKYGRFEARLRFAAGDGVVGSFFLWKDGSEVSGTFWNELDFEKIGADCHIESNALYGKPASVHAQSHVLDADLCGTFHTYAYEWTADAIAWFVDGVEVRRDTGPTATAFADNAAAGMQIRLNVWPGDITFGGNFSPSILPVHQYVDWVQFSSYEGGAFTLEWREDFDGGTVPAGFLTATWGSPKNLSTHDPGNINFIDGYAVLSLTADDAVGPAGAMPVAAGGAGGNAGASSGGNSGMDTGGTTGSGSGGSAGAVSAGTGGTSTGGTAGTAVGGTAGASAGGSAGTDSGGTGGAGSSAASSSGGSAGSAAGSGSEAEDGGGCSCSTPGERDASALLGALGFAALAGLGRRRQRSRRGRPA